MGIEVKYTQDGGMLLSQEQYITDLLKKTKMLEVKGISTPMISGRPLSAKFGDPFDDPTLYRSTVGALQYVTVTRPKISYSVSKGCQFMHDPL